MNLAASTALRRALEDGDVASVQAVWAELFPNHPRPLNGMDAFITFHYARTVTESISLDVRRYSHAWLCERGLPSGLPDALRPRSEQIEPKISEAVGISANFRSKILRPVKPIVERAMSDAVSECYADRRTEPSFVKARLLAAKDRTIKKLFGRLGSLS